MKSLRHPRSTIKQHQDPIIGFIIGLVTIVFLVFFTAHEINENTIDYLQEFNPKWARYQYRKNLTTRYHNRMGEKIVSRQVEINRPMQEVFDAVMTSQLWRICYPETVAVGGMTHRPFKRGDLILEKFFFGGTFFSQFRYEVDEYRPPTRSTFHGDVIMMNDELQKLVGKEMANFGGTFEYELEERGVNKTLWKRHVHFYYVKDELSTKIAFSLYFNTIHKSQERGASLFVECVREFLEREDYREELYGIP